MSIYNNDNDNDDDNVAHRCTIFLCIWDDQHRNTNMNDKDHLVGQLTNDNDDKEYQHFKTLLE